MDRMKNGKVQLFEMALAMGLVLTLLFCMGAERSQKELADRLLRLHVIAPSDKAEDQALKLRVRDRVLETAAACLAEARDVESAMVLLEENLPELERVAREQVLSDGCDYSVTVSLTTDSFPTKVYDGFALPPGDYEALRVVLGEGQGQNWWCVVFPPLCAAAASDELEKEALRAGLTEEHLRLITQEDQTYVVKFKTLEIWEAVKRFFRGK